jgi:dolichol-phosphate mannosyltransferase
MGTTLSDRAAARGNLTVGPAREPLELLSVVIPAHNEEGCISSTVEHLHLELRLRSVPHEIVVIDDGSTDATWQKLVELAEHIAELKPVQNRTAHGFGRAVAKGFDSMTGDAVVVMMADESDDCRDVARYWELLNEGWDAVFGSRFVKGGGVIDYPWFKLKLNRIANLFLRMMFGIKLNDTTNAFKAYRSSVIEGCRPLLAPHFNLTVELHLQAQDQGDGQPLPVHLPLRLARKVFQPGRLPQAMKPRGPFSARTAGILLGPGRRLAD